MEKNKNTRIKPKVAFICVHNSCRSQIAEALGKHLASDVFESYSAGTETKNCINPDAVRIMKQLYGIDMEETQHPKLECVVLMSRTNEILCCLGIFSPHEDPFKDLIAIARFFGNFHVVGIGISRLTASQRYVVLS